MPAGKAENKKKVKTSHWNRKNIKIVTRNNNKKSKKWFDTDILLSYDTHIFLSHQSTLTSQQNDVS